MYNELIKLENVFSAWREFRTGKNNRPDVMLFERNLEDNLFVLREELLNHSYKHGQYHTFHIWDPKHRVISKAAVRDRVVHHLVFIELYRIFNPTFIFHSYSSRIGKGTHLAVKNLSNILRSASHNYTKPSFALKCDIKKFFDSVSHQKLLQIIQRKIKDSQFLWMVEQIITGFSSQPLFNTQIPSGGGG
ncbi:MAG: reverse transcriptase domain-containing protein [Candidatus Magasanikbacteria bacterium]